MYITAYTCILLLFIYMFLFSISLLGNIIRSLLKWLLKVQWNRVEGERERERGRGKRKGGRERVIFFHFSLQSLVGLRKIC